MSKISVENVSNMDNNSGRVAQVIELIWDDNTGKT